MTNIHTDKMECAMIDNKIVQDIEDKYDCTLPKQIMEFLALDLEERFTDEYRILSDKEILYAEENLGLDFASLKMIPAIDTYDNDFIAFDLIDESWVKINIVDEVVFDRTNSVEDFIKKHEESIS